MLSYQVRKRYFKIPSSAQISFPSDFAAVFCFKPLQAFGKSADGGRTGVRGIAASILFNANTGHHYIQSETPLEPLKCIIEEPDQRIELAGNELKISGQTQSLDQLNMLLHSVHFALPLILNVEFADPPVIERVHGAIADIPFRWELEDWWMLCDLTTQEEQEQAVVNSCERMNLLSRDDNARLRAALHYFHVFCRLCRAGQTPWEFMAEGIVNLAKTLESLFPPGGDGKSMEAARSELQKLEYSTAEIERYFVPAILLRNHVDSAHVDLTLFTLSELRTLQAYTEAAEAQFRGLLKRVLSEMAAGRYKLGQATQRRPDARVIRIIERLRQSFAASNAGEALEGKK